MQASERLFLKSKQTQSGWLLRNSVQLTSPCTCGECILTHTHIRTSSLSPEFSPPGSNLSIITQTADPIFHHRLPPLSSPFLVSHAWLPWQSNPNLGRLGPLHFWWSQQSCVQCCSCSSTQPGLSCRHLGSMLWPKLSSLPHQICSPGVTASLPPCPSRELKIRLGSLPLSLLYVT